MNKLTNFTGYKMTIIAIIPCGKSKIWDKQPGAGAVAAERAYTGALCRLSRDYAVIYCDSWFILSAKYGIIRPDFVIPGPYEVTFNRPSPEVVTTEILRRQTIELKLTGASRIVVLGGKAYCFAVRSALFGSGFCGAMEFPVEGLPIGKMLGFLKRAVS